MARQLPGPESLRDLVLVSSPRVDPTGSVVLYLATRLDLDADRYEHTIWMLEASGEKRVLESGPGDTCPVPGPLGRRYLFIRRLEPRPGQKRTTAPRVELRVSTPGSTGSQVLLRARHVSAVEWSPDGRLVAAAVVEGRPDEDVKVVDDLPLWFNGRGYTYWARSRLLLLSPEAGAPTPVEGIGSDWAEIHSLAWSPDGKRVAVAASTDRHHPYLVTVYIVDVESLEARPLAEGLSGYAGLAWSPDGRRLAYLGHMRERGFSTHNHVYLIDPETGEASCATCSLDLNHVGTVNSDARGPSCSPRIQWTERGILFVTSERGRQRLRLHRPDMGETEVIVDPGDGAVDEFSASRSGETIAYTAMSLTEPKDLYLYRAGTVERVTEAARAWRAKYRAPLVEETGFTASDGAEVQGWIIRPPEGVEEKGWILYIHGGPKTMWGYGFMHEFHVLAAAGYTVAAFNPRGSDGYSQDYADIRCHYGERDAQDLVEAHHYLTEQAGLPGDRAAVMGGSYGGYMTNWLIATQPDLFKAAVTMRGISNWTTMYTTSDIGWYFVEDQICCSPWRNPDKCWHHSPLRHAPNVKTPTLIIHGAEDYRCWLDQAIQWFTALRLHGARARLAIFPGENHDLSRSGKPRHRLKRLELILGWLDDHIAGREGGKAGEG